MNHAEIRRSLSEGICVTLLRQEALPKKPRPYQVETLESCVRWLDNPEGTKRAYVSHATGLGKTILFAIIVSSAPQLRSLIVVPTKALLEQTARKVVQFTGGLLGHLSSLSDIQDEAGEDIVAVRGLDHSSVVLTTDASFNKLAARIRAQFDPHLIIRDECHWGYVGPALAALDQFAEAVVIGFSATPDYLTSRAKDGYLPVQLENGRTLYGPRDRFAETHFQTCLDRRTVRWGIESGWLAPLAWGFVEFEISLKGIPIVDTADGPDYQPDKLQELMGKHWTVMCETIRRLYEKGDYDLPNRQVFAVCPSVLAAEELAEAIASLGISSACVTGSSTTIERNVILPAFNESEIRFLASVMVLREGWDAPPAEICMMLRPTVSRVLYEQSIGRGLRLSEKNPDKVALVLDAHFQGRKLCPLSAPAIYGKPGDEIHVGDFLIKGGHGGESGDFTVSPYLPKNADPRIVVVDMLDNEAEAQYTARPDGAVVIDDEIYLNRRSISIRLGSSNSESQKKRLESPAIRKVMAKDRTGRTLPHYAWTDVQQVFADRLTVTDQAPDSFFVDNEGTRWETVSLYSQPRGYSESAVKNLIKAAALSPKRARLKNGHVRDLYRVTDLEKVCVNLPKKDALKANASGYAEADGESWYTQTAIINKLEVSLDAWNRRKEKVRHRPGVDWGNHATTLYCLSDALILTNDLREARLQNREDGFALIGGRRHGSPNQIAQFFSSRLDAVRRIHAETVKRRLLKIGAKSERCVNASGQPTDFYAVEDAERACADILEQKHLADDRGYFDADGKKWGSAEAYAGLYSITVSTVHNRAEKFSVQTRQGLNRIHQPAAFFEFEGMREACKDFFKRHTESTTEESATRADVLS